MGFGDLFKIRRIFRSDFSPFIFAQALAPTQDLNGDGLEDIMLAIPLEHTTASQAGRLRIISPF